MQKGKSNLFCYSLSQQFKRFFSYIPYPGGGEKWGGNGVGDDLYSFGFDGAFLWSGGRCTQVINNPREPYIRKSKIAPKNPKNLFSN